MDRKKIQVIREAPLPTTTTELRSLLGLAGYYRIFIKGFADTTSFLHAPTLGNKKPTFSDDMKKAFEELKRKITSAPVLAVPNFDLHFHVETDASSVAVTVILPQ